MKDLRNICSSAYNDGSQPTGLTYSDHEVLSYGYDGGSGWLSSLTATPAGGSATTLLSSIGYSGAGGAAGHPTSASVANGTYSYSASYDSDLRLSSLSLANASSGTMLFASQRGYDAVGNVTAVGTTLAAGTDNQVFCYDDQHRLTWAGSAGTPNCGTSLTPGSLSAASYAQSYTYDTLDRLQSGPLGSYSYGDSAHLHAVTSIANGGTTAYSAAYDAGGNMTCRAADGSGTTTCAGTPTGAQLIFDNEGRLSGWQNAPTTPTSSDSFLYDGAGNRVEQQTTTNGSILTSTVYVAGGLEEITSTGSTTTLTKYFGASGLPTAERVGTNGPLSYLATDGQGTVSETLDGSGNVTSAQLYTPYGSVRYSSGSSPTSLGYTGQRNDATTGLDDYHARYYDPVAGQFTSADTVQDGLNRYGYVAGNPTTATDPSGHMLNADGTGGVGGDSGWAKTYPAYKQPLSPNVNFPENSADWSKTDFPRKDMKALSAKVVNVQNAHGGPGPNRTTYGGVVLSYSSAAGNGVESFGPYASMKFGDDGVNTELHAEDGSINKAAQRIRELVQQWGQFAAYAEFTVNLITTLPPCRDKCQKSFNTGAWMKQLLDAAGGRLPGASGGSTGITIKLDIWYIEPDPSNPLSSSLLMRWNGQEDQEEIPQFWVE